jgi:hypothetical protein
LKCTSGVGRLRIVISGFSTSGYAKAVERANSVLRGDESRLQNPVMDLRLDLLCGIASSTEKRSLISCSA